MKHYFIGLMLASGANTESGIAIINRENEIILLDKLFTMQDIQHFFDNFSSLKNSHLCVSLPVDNSMLNGKWRILSKLYQHLGFNEKIPNTNNWTQRYSTRGCEYFSNLIDQDISINRYELYLTRQALNINSYFKERSPADCKALQSALKIKYGFTTLPPNMMPMSQLEALVGAVLAKKIAEQNVLEASLFDFNGIAVIRGN